MKTYKVALLPGDGIGPEIAQEAKKVLDAVRTEAKFEVVEAAFGGNAYLQTGKSFTDEAKQICDDADAILKGPIGLVKEEHTYTTTDEGKSAANHEVTKELSSVSGL